MRVSDAVLLKRLILKSSTSVTSAAGAHTARDLKAGGRPRLSRQPRLDDIIPHKNCADASSPPHHELDLSARLYVTQHFLLQQSVSALPAPGRVLHAAQHRRSVQLNHTCPQHSAKT